LTGGPRGKPLDPAMKKVLENIHWDGALRNANRLYDQIVAAMRLPERQTRENQLEQIEQAIKQRKVSLGDPFALGLALLDAKATPESRGAVIGDVLISLLVPA